MFILAFLNRMTLLLFWNIFRCSQCNWKRNKKAPTSWHVSISERWNVSVSVKKRKFHLRLIVDGFCCWSEEKKMRHVFRLVQMTAWPQSKKKQPIKSLKQEDIQPRCHTDEHFCETSACISWNFQNFLLFFVLTCATYLSPSTQRDANGLQDVPATETLNQVIFYQPRSWYIFPYKCCQEDSPAPRARIQVGKEGCPRTAVRLQIQGSGHGWGDVMKEGKPKDERRKM